jgi:hypothetical protein
VASGVSKGAWRSLNACLTSQQINKSVHAFLCQKLGANVPIKCANSITPPKGAKCRVGEFVSLRLPHQAQSGNVIIDTNNNKNNLKPDGPPQLLVKRIARLEAIFVAHNLPDEPKALVRLLPYRWKSITCSYVGRPVVRYSEGDECQYTLVAVSSVSRRVRLVPHFVDRTATTSLFFVAGKIKRSRYFGDATSPSSSPPVPVDPSAYTTNQDSPQPSLRRSDRLPQPSTLILESKSQDVDWTLQGRNFH